MLTRSFRGRTFLSAFLPLSLVALCMVVYSEEARASNFEVYQNEAAFYAKLKQDTITVVDFDYYPDGTPVPTGYSPAGVYSGFELTGYEWSALGVTFSTPSEQKMSTVNITEKPQGNIYYNYNSPPNSLTLGQPPFIGWGVPQIGFTEDPLFIRFNPPRYAVGLVFIDNRPLGADEHVEFRAADGSVIADLPSPATGYNSFLGIISDVPVAAINIFEKPFDGDDVAYDDIVYGIPTGLFIKAKIEINPETLNLKSEGKWITAYVELPDGYNVADISISTVILDGVIPAALLPNEVDDYDDDGIADLMVKFDRQALIEYLDGTMGKVILTVAGELSDGLPFEGNDTITVINP